MSTASLVLVREAAWCCGKCTGQTDGEGKYCSEHTKIQDNTKHQTH
jgi:hypothetical protein